MRNVCSGPCATTPIVSPSAKCLPSAVALSIAISRGALGQRPLVSTSGLKRWLPAGLTLNARPGPCVAITLPSWPTSCDWSSMPPSAWATPGRPRTFVSSVSENDGTVSACALFDVPIALLPVITASVCS